MTELNEKGKQALRDFISNTEEQLEELTTELQTLKEIAEKSTTLTYEDIRDQIGQLQECVECFPYFFARYLFDLDRSGLLIKRLTCHVGVDNYIEWRRDGRLARDVY